MDRDRRGVESDQDEDTAVGVNGIAEGLRKFVVKG